MPESEKPNTPKKKLKIIPLLLRIAAGVLFFFALTLIIGYFFSDLRKDLAKYYIFQLISMYFFDTEVEKADPVNYFGIAFLECAIACLCLFGANKLSKDDKEDD